MSVFRLWAGGYSHVHTDLKYGRKSLAETIRHSEQGGDEGAPPLNGTLWCTWAISWADRHARTMRTARRCSTSF